MSTKSMDYVAMFIQKRYTKQVEHIPAEIKHF